MKMTSDVDYTDVNCPIKPPRLVREFGNVFVLLSILLLPVGCVSVLLTTQHVPMSQRNTVGTLIAMAFFVIWFPLPFLISRIQQSRWLLSVIRYYIDINAPHEAYRVAWKYSRGINYGDFSKAVWFQSFLIEHQLNDPWGVYGEYFHRLPPTDP